MRKILVLFALSALAMACAVSANASQPVLQRGYDAGVTGANLAEITLNTSNVSPTTFGLAFKLPVDDNVYAQPLYMPNLAIPNQGTHNVVYVATMSDTLYAFDADAGGAPLWSANFASRVGATPVPIGNFVFSGSRNIVGNLGILSTPVIDPATNIMYLVACTLENNTLAYRLHAVDITTGADLNGAGMLISGSYGGSTFDPRYQWQRPSLALSGNQVVIAFGPLELEYPGGYVGWVMAYDKQTLLQSGVFATVTLGNRGGGVWQSGRSPAVDSSGYVYVFVGNGFGSGYDGVNNFSESVLKLDPANGLKLVDWFTPGNWSYLDTNDFDLGASGPILIPGTNLLAGGGKTGDLYVLNTANLGHFNASDAQVVQREHICPYEIKGGPVYWPRSAANGGPLLYNWGAFDWIKAYAFNGTTIGTSPSFQGSGTQFWPGGILTLSANGEQHGSGVLWATVATSDAAENSPPAPGELRAFNAEDVSQELWNSAMNSARDNFGNYAKFVPPLVVNGKVYVATSSNQVAVYGLLSAPPPFNVTMTVSSQAVLAGNAASYTMNVSASNGFAGLVTLSVSGLPAGATASFSPATVTGSGSSTLTVTTSGATPLGTSTLTIMATSGSLTYTTNVTLVVTSAGAIGINFVGQGTAMGSTETAGVVPQTHWNNASGTASTSGLGLVNQTGASSGASVTWNTNGIWSLGITDTAGNNRMMRGYLDTAGGKTTVTVAGLPANVAGYDVYVYADGSNGGATRTGAYQISGTGITTTSVNLTDAAGATFGGTFTRANNSNGNYVLFTIAATGFTITATPGATTDAYARAPLNAVQIVPRAAATPDFSLTATPSSQTVVVGSAASFTVNVAASNGFTGVVMPIVSGLPAGATASFSPSTLTGSGSSTLTVTTSGTTPVATSTLTITGTSGSLTHTAGVVLAVVATPPPPDFSLTATPGSQTVVAGSATSYTTNVGALYGFADVVTLSASGMPAGVTVSFSPATVTGSGSSTLTVTTSGTTPVATSTLTITGTAGSLAHTAGVTLAVTGTPPPPDFSLTATPSSQIVGAGSTTSYTVKIAASNGFTGGVTPTVSGLPAGATASFSPATLTGSGSSTLTVITSGTTPVATSTLTITGTSGSLIHSTSVTLAVTNAAAIGIKFVGQGTAMGSAEVAGVVAQSHWNNASGTANTSGLALVNQNGANSGARVTWNTNGVWSLGITDTAGNNRMMRGYLDPVGAKTTVTVAGLPANAAGYAVYVYADGSNAGASRTGAYQISGTGITTASVNLTDAAGATFNGTFTRANNSNGNFVLFTITATGFTIIATPGASTDIYLRAPLNAIQIVPK